jgi:tRNA(fMet)-specific endonuclease VapC
LHGRSLAVSIVTIGDIEYGMASRGWSDPRRGQMRRLLGRFTSIPAEDETARLWARVQTECERKGRPIGFAHAWIAATALLLDIPLVNHNAKDYESIDALTIITAGA